MKTQLLSTVQECNSIKVQDLRGAYVKEKCLADVSTCKYCWLIINGNGDIKEKLKIYLQWVHCSML